MKQQGLFDRIATSGRRLPPLLEAPKVEPPPKPTTIMVPNRIVPDRMDPMPPLPDDVQFAIGFSYGNGEPGDWARVVTTATWGEFVREVAEAKRRAMVPPPPKKKAGAGKRMRRL